MSIFVFIYGLIIGSFLNVLIVRLPQNRSIVTPRSKCNNCNNTIRWYDNIPLISYIILKAKCRDCNYKISIIYPIVELLSAIITLILYLKLSFSIEFIQLSIIFYLFIVLSFIDLKYKAVPDYLLLFILLFSIFILPFDIVHLNDAILFAGGFVLLNFIVTFYIQNIKSKFNKDDTLKNQEALGEGDIPIVASIAAILGIKSAFIAIFLAALFALIPSIYNTIIKKDIQTPFIPFLALGCIVEYIFNFASWFIV
jgi:leader peptidase (prepilin peptidase)/N-methyltransferase